MKNTINNFQEPSFGGQGGFSVSSVQSVKSVIQTSVYKARTINAILQPGMQYYDDVLCAAAMPLNKNGSNPFQDEENILNNGIADNGIIKMIKEGSIKLYPNPTNVGGIVHAIYNLPTNTETNIVITDAVGRKVQELQFVSDDTRKVSMHLNANLSSGIYKVVVMQNSLTLYTEKLNVLE